MYNNRGNQSCLICVYTAASASSCQVYPSEYAYHKNSVYRTESSSANCRNYHTVFVGAGVLSNNYIHCDGTQLRLTDSYYGSEQYSDSDYYVWPAEISSQLLFIFPTRINLTTIQLHYYHTSVRGLPRLRFWAVPDDFDIWDAPSASYSYINFAAVPPDEEPAGLRNISITNIQVTTKKVLLTKFSSSYSFALSEVEFFTRACTSKSC